MSRLLFDFKSAGHALSLSQRDIRALVHIGELPSVQIRGRKLIHRNSLIAFAQIAVPTEL